MKTGKNQKERQRMGGRLRMYNVQFGDAFLLYGQGENLLVDLGSIQGAFCFNQVRDSIRAESAGGQLSLMLTHFHRDHWSGLHNQPAGHPLPPIKMIYLPDIFQMRFYGRLDVIVRSLLGDFLEAVVLRKRPQFTLADLLREVLPGLSGRQIRFLSRGDTFSVGGQDYEVLWPRLETEDVVGARNKRLLEFIERVEAKLAAAGAEDRLWDTMEAMANVLLRDFAASLDQRISPVVGAEQRLYEDVYDRAQRLAEALMTDVQQDEGAFRDQVRYYAEQLSRDWNRVSLVFQERCEADGGGILMTGDAPRTVMKRLASGTLGTPGLLEQYAVIKAPHHGTGSHFCAVLPNCRYLCISSGTGNRGYRKITEEYEYVYGSLGKKAEICCTNPWCEFRDRRRPCPCFDAGPPRSFYDVCW